MNNKHDLAEDLFLENPLELNLQNKEYKSFELLLNFFQNDEIGRKAFVYQVLMRNLRGIMEVPELESTFANFFIDDPESGNSFTFGYKLK